MAEVGVISAAAWAAAQGPAAGAEAEALSDQGAKGCRCTGVKDWAVAVGWAGVSHGPDGPEHRAC